MFHDGVVVANGHDDVPLDAATVYDVYTDDCAFVCVCARAA